MEGIPYEKLIHWIKVKEIDLLVVGHKEVSDGSGITAKRVARTSKCNVIFVPEDFNKKLEYLVLKTGMNHFIRLPFKHLKKAKTPSMYYIIGKKYFSSFLVSDYQYMYS